MVVVAAFALRRFLYSEFGTVLRAVGSKEQALVFYKRQAGAYKIVGLSLGNGLAAVGGSLSSQHQGFSDVNMGVGVLVAALASLMLGREILLRFGANVDRVGMMLFGAILGALLYQILISVVLSAGAPPSMLRLLSGVTLVVVLGFRKKRRAEVGAW
jgi:putative ABC transport system permease protein